jgi:pimeloyl-ACP methyl ester carboxylesterase
MTYYKGNQNHLLIALFTSSLLASMLIVNSSIAGQGLRASDTTTKTTNNTQFGSMMNNMTMSSTVKKVRVGDIDIAYKMFGKGKRLLLIAGSGATMDMWDPVVLRQLSANHTVIIFDNRGKGQTSAGTIKNMTMSQFANDTAGLIDALGIRKPVDVLGISLGGFIAQELALLHPEKVDRLIIFASNCSGKIATPPAPLAAPLAKLANPNSNLTPIDQARIIADLIFPQQWKKEHPNYVSYMPLVPVPSLKAVQLEAEAMGSWKGTCDRLSSISKPTLVIVGTDDVVIPPAYSLPLAQKIPGAWLVQIKGGGHGVMYQYPDKFSRIVLTFLET